MILIMAMARSSGTLLSLLGTYIAHHPSLSEQASRNIERDLVAFRDWCGRPLMLGDLAGDDVLAFLRYRSLQGDSAATVNGRRAKILAVWRFAAELGLCVGPQKIPRLKEPVRIPRAWTIEQIERLLAHARQLQGDLPNGVSRCVFWPAMILAGYWTGCRPRALLSAYSCDFDAGRSSLIIRAETEKTGRDRYYHLHPQCVEAITHICDPCRDRLFPWPHCLRHFWTCFRRIVEGAGLPSSKDGRDLFYRLRRTNLSYCAAADERIAQTQGGHADFATTRRYLDPSIARSRSAADVLPVPRIQSDTRQMMLPGF